MNVMEINGRNIFLPETAWMKFKHLRKTVAYAIFFHFRKPVLYLFFITKTSEKFIKMLIGYLIFQ